VALGSVAAGPNGVQPHRKTCAADSVVERPQKNCCVATSAESRDGIPASLMRPAMAIPRRGVGFGATPPPGAQPVRGRAGHYEAGDGMAAARLPGRADGMAYATARGGGALIRQ